MAVCGTIEYCSCVGWFLEVYGSSSVFRPPMGTLMKVCSLWTLLFFSCNTSIIFVLVFESCERICVMCAERLAVLQVVML